MAANDDRSIWAAIGERQRHVVLAGAAVLALLFFDQTAVIVALPSIQDDLGTSTAATQWTVTAFLLALAVFMPWAGRLADRYGRKRVLLAGMVVFGIGSLLSAVAPSLPALIAFRFVQGVGAAVMQPLALVAGTRDAPAERRGRLIGLMSTGGTAFLIIGPLIAAAILSVGSWRWLFLVNLPVLAYATAVIARRLPPSPGPGGRPRWGEALLLTVGLAGLVLGISQLVALGWIAVGIVGVGGVFLGALVRIELRRRDPLIPLRHLRNRLLVGCLVALFAIEFAVLAAMVALVGFLDDGLDLGAAAAGLVVAATGACTPLLSIRTGRAADKLGPRPLVVAGLAFATLGLAGVALAGGADSLAWLMPGLLVFSVARPAVFTPAGVGPFAVLPAADRAFAASLITEARQLGAVFGVAVAGVTGELVSQRTDPTRGFVAQMWVIVAVLATAAVLAATFMPRPRGRRPAGHGAAAGSAAEGPKSDGSVVAEEGDAGTPGSGSG